MTKKQIAEIILSAPSEVANGFTQICAVRLINNWRKDVSHTKCKTRFTPERYLCEMFYQARFYRMMGDMLTHEQIYRLAVYLAVKLGYYYPNQSANN